MLSAFMFLVYIDDLLYELCTSTSGKLMGSLHIPGILLADDTALISNSPRSLQESLYVVELYVYKWRLHYNPNKSVSVVFNKQSHISLELDVQLFDNVIPNCNDVIYAGCLLQANLKSDRLVERACKNARSKTHSLHPVGVYNSQINPAVSAKIWKKLFFLLLFIHVNFGLTSQKRTSPNWNTPNHIFQELCKDSRNSHLLYPVHQTWACDCVYNKASYIFKTSCQECVY